MKIIVTGASGFLGREVCLAALRRGHEVLALGGSRAPVVPVSYTHLTLPTIYSV